MKFSIITPEHTLDNIDFLEELYDSILEQTYEDWEWILYLNNGVELKDIPERIVTNSKVSIFEDYGNNYIGRIKHEAFFKGTGDILVEVDHDDILLPNCLEKLYEAYSLDDDIGFVFSDTLVYDMKDEFIPYGRDYGWTFDIHEWRGLNLTRMHSFPACGKSLRSISWAPDHVRTWRKSVYQQLDGHDITLSVCDDLDLLQRTYLVTKMQHIPEPLYVYRITGNNSWLDRIEDIQQFTNDLFYQHVRLLAERDAEVTNTICIDLGGGLYPYKPTLYKSVDIRSTADIYCDLNKRIPLEDSSVGVVNAHHVLEHLNDPIHSMQEIYRVLQHGGWAFIEVPSTDGRGAFQDPTHKSFWNLNSFQYYTNKDKEIFVDANVRFQVIVLKDYYPSDQMKEENVLVTCAVLVAIKDDNIRYPGELNI